MMGGLREREEFMGDLEEKLALCSYWEDCFDKEGSIVHSLSLSEKEGGKLNFIGGPYFLACSFICLCCY